MSAAGRKATRRLVVELQKQGFLCELTRNRHYKVRHPEREGLVVFGSQPNTENLHLQIKQLVKLGFKP